MSATWRFCYESLTIISSLPEQSVRCRDVSAIKHVGYIEVSLYLFLRIEDCNYSAQMNFRKLAEKSTKFTKFAKINTSEITTLKVLGTWEQSENTENLLRRRKTSKHSHELFKDREMPPFSSKAIPQHNHSVAKKIYWFQSILLVSCS